MNGQHATALAPPPAIPAPSGPPPPRAALQRRGLWVTWERQRRNGGIAAALGVPCVEIDLPGSRVRRYVLSLWRTAGIYVAKRPEVIFVQNPSLVLTLMTLVWGSLTRTRVVVDAHNGALLPLEGQGSRLMRWLSAFAVRRADLTIVSNQALAPLVGRSGGTPGVLADRIPSLPPPPPRRDRGGPVVVFICTFAADEPYMAVLEAARQVGPGVTIYVTGNPRHRAEMVRAAAPPNVVLTGFLPEPRYIELIQSADVVIDLTTREDCLVCGAYEAVAAGRPMILSGTAATRGYFNQGVIYTDNSAADLARAIREALAAAEVLLAGVGALKRRLEGEWESQLGVLIGRINGGQA